MKAQLKAVGAWFEKAGNTNFALASVWFSLFLVFGVGRGNVFLMVLDGFMVVFNLGLGYHASYRSAQYKERLAAFEARAKAIYEKAAEDLKKVEEKL